MNKIIVGLGNPGHEYTGTRHNIGFDVIDTFARLHSSNKFISGKGKFLQLPVDFEQHRILLVKPLTFMNLSGEAVAFVLNFYKISITDILIVCDDVNIPLGELRFKPKGNTGGQNGLKSIITSLGRNDFPRLRFGIATTHPISSSLSNFVLSKFSNEELTTVEKYIKLACMGIECFIQNGISITMNQFNKRASR